MEFYQYKLFISPKSDEVNAIPVPEYDYYKFVRLNIEQGYSQVVIPSNILIALLKYFFLNKKAKIVDINFLEEDDENKKQMTYLIDKVNVDREFFVDLMEELNFLSAQETVEIKNIRLMHRDNGKSVDLKLSLNGLLTVGGKGDIEGDIKYINDYVWENLKSWV